MLAVIYWKDSFSFHIDDSSCVLTVDRDGQSAALASGRGGVGIYSKYSLNTL